MIFGFTSEYKPVARPLEPFCHHVIELRTHTLEGKAREKGYGIKQRWTIRLPVTRRSILMAGIGGSTVMPIKELAHHICVCPLKFINYVVNQHHIT